MPGAAGTVVPQIGEINMRAKSQMTSSGFLDANDTARMDLASEMMLIPESFEINSGMEHFHEVRLYRYADR